MSERVYVALGSNLGDRAAHLARACDEIAGMSWCAGLVCSSLYETDPMGPQDQPDYVNAVCRFDCALEPLALLAALQSIERDHGRSRSVARWTARPLDLDMLLFGDRMINTAVLQVPHPGMVNRSFVLYPLAELDARLVVPGLGPVSELLHKCVDYGIRTLNPGKR